MCHDVQAPEIGDAFFSALDRVHAIHANCKSLLRTHHQRAGLELMDAMAAHQETAYERLCRCSPVPTTACSYTASCMPHHHTSHHMTHAPSGFLH